MKKNLIALSILVSALSLYSCNKVEPVVIEAPVTEKTEPEETTP